VAQEIRALAERARAFTDQIKGLVRDIHGATGATLEANEQATQDALVGTRLAEQAMTVLDRIAQEVRRTGLAADEIAAATAQQRAASDQVAAAMAQVARVSTQHANGTQQLARSVAAQHEMAERMRTVIDRFRLD
jgi:methyl-accepting chemotaxis protein